MGKPRTKVGNAPTRNVTKKPTVATARAEKQEEIESNAESESLRESSSNRGGGNSSPGKGLKMVVDTPISSSSASETSSEDGDEDPLPPSSIVGQKRKSRAVEETKASELALERELCRLNKYFKVIDETALVTVHGEEQQ